MDEKELKEIMNVFKPMNKYYSLLLKEKEDELNSDLIKQTELEEYAIIIKNGINKYRTDIIINFDSKQCSCSGLFEDSKQYLQRNQSIPYYDDGGYAWNYIKDDFEFITILEAIIEEINLNSDQKQKEELDKFIKKYSLLAKEELEKEKHFIPNTTWLAKKAYENEDLIPKLGNSGQIVQILKANNQMPKRKIRKAINEDLKKSILKRDKWKCQHCGIDLSPIGGAWEINHIDKNPSNNDPTNLELTCRLCNRKWGG